MSGNSSKIHQKVIKSESIPINYMCIVSHNMRIAAKVGFSRDLFYVITGRYYVTSCSLTFRFRYFSLHQ